MIPPSSQSRPPAPRPAKRSLFRNLGAFFGHIAHGVRTPVGPEHPPAQPLQTQGDRHVVRQETQQQEVLTPEGKVVLRRTVIDEIERVPDGGRPAQSPGDPG